MSLDTIIAEIEKLNVLELVETHQDPARKVGRERCASSGCRRPCCSC